MVIQAYKYLQQRSMDNTGHTETNMHKLMEQRKRSVTQATHHVSPKKQKIVPTPTSINTTSTTVENSPVVKDSPTNDDVMVIQADNGSAEDRYTRHI